MLMDVVVHALPPSVQGRDHSGLAVQFSRGDPLEDLATAGTEQTKQDRLVGLEQRIEIMRECEHDVPVAAARCPLADRRLPRLASAVRAGRTMAVGTAIESYQRALAAITVEHVATELASAAGGQQVQHAGQFFTGQRDDINLGHQAMAGKQRIVQARRRTIVASGCW